MSQFIRSLPQPIRSKENLRPLEKMCLDKDRKGGFSQTYRSLIGLGNIETPSFIQKWEKELGRELTYLRSLILSRAAATSVNSKILELNYRCLTRMYLTPDRLNKFQNGPPQHCWRGCKELGSMTHIWWQCPTIKIFWTEVRGFIKDITGISILDDPWVCLFHISEMPNKAYLRTLLPHLLDAAKSLIPKYWRRIERPAMKDWLEKINEIHTLEYLRYSEGTKMGVFETKWKGWAEFKTSLRAAEIWTA